MCERKKINRPHADSKITTALYVDIQSHVVTFEKQNQTHPHKKERAKRRFMRETNNERYNYILQHSNTRMM
jgi:uncharacterized short protein YbdD (DUF466 family)